MRIVSNTGGLAYTNCYLVVDDETRACALFDTPDHTITPLLDLVSAEKLDLIGLWLTHGHFDHVADHQLVRDRFPDAKHLIHPLDEPKLRRPGSAMFTLPFHIPPGHADGSLTDGQTLAIGSIEVRVLFTPGHSPGHVSFHMPDHDVLIGGDLIIGGSVGRTDLPDSSQADLDHSIRRVMALPGKTQLLSGHGGPSTLADEGRANGYVRALLLT